MASSKRRPMSACPHCEGNTSEAGSGQTGGKVSWSGTGNRQAYWETDDSLRIVRSMQDRNWAGRQKKSTGKTRITAENKLAMDESESVA